ncbi:4a-hydroxytetrahydrobiopterin dehydratase [Deinococcus sonorensis]|uniref:Putative pterin-4-alpha-carbinolamine dehydratase n=1 Tax=Deinococcus sonorensis TaxID=309891 RepID=A0ABV8Y9N1_9DEIO
MSRAARTRLSAEELADQLPDGWSGDTSSVTREFQFPSYQAGVAFAVRVATQAEASDHHPDLLIGYRRVQVRYSTHDAGGVTALDLREASAVNGLF